MPGIGVGITSQFDPPAGVTVEGAFLADSGDFMVDDQGLYILFD